MIAWVGVAVPLPFPLLSSTSDPGGDTNRAVGRGPEAEGPLGFFRIGCKILVEDVAELLFGFDIEAPEVTGIL